MEAWPSGQRIGLAVRRSLVKVLLWALAGFVRLCRPECTSSLTFVNSQLVAFWQVFFLLIAVFEWSTLKVAGKEKYALNLQTFQFWNVRGQCLCFRLKNRSSLRTVLHFWLLEDFIQCHKEWKFQFYDVVIIVERSSYAYLSIVTNPWILAYWW